MRLNLQERSFDGPDAKTSHLFECERHGRSQIKGKSPISKFLKAPRKRVSFVTVSAEVVMHNNYWVVHAIVGKSRLFIK
jgi:hypothetical protein